MVPQMMLENIRLLAKEAKGFINGERSERDLQWAARCMDHILFQLESYENAIAHQKSQKNCAHKWKENQDKRKFCSLCGISAQSVASTGGWL